MSWLEEVLLTVLVGLSPIWAALVIGAICWAARYFGEPTGTKETERRILRSAQNDGEKDEGTDSSLRSE